MKKTKFYVCPECGNTLQGTGDEKIICCGKEIMPLAPCECTGTSDVTVSEVDGDFYITFDHEMTKEHYIGFVAYVGFDRVLTIKLYPEQDASVRFPKMHGGKLYCYCNQHGLFEYKI